MIARLSFCVVFVLLAACAAAVPGYTPPPFKERSKMAKGMESGEIQGDQYVMAEKEKEMDCKRTTGSMTITLERLKYRSKEVGTSDIAVAANQAAAPLGRNSAKGLDRDAVYARDRARLEAYNRHLAAKGCRTVDIDAELAKPPEPRGKKY